MTAAQRRLVDEILRQGGAEGGAEFWPVVNDWVKDAGRTRSLALRNINRTVDALIRRGAVTLDDDGFFHVPCPTCGGTRGALATDDGLNPKAVQCGTCGTLRLKGGAR